MRHIPQHLVKAQYLRKISVLSEIGREETCEWS